MALQIWLPLNGNLNNQGLAKIKMTSTNAATYVDGKIGQAIKFADSTATSIYDSSVCQDLKYTDNFSYCMWIKNISKGSGNASYLFTVGRADAGSYGYGVYVQDSTTIGFRFGTHIMNKNVVDGKWNFIAFTKSGTTLTYYINGVVSTATFSGTLPSYIPSEYGGLGIGCFHYSGNIYPCNVTMNDFRIYDHCLSLKELKEISRGLIGHYKLDGELSPTGIEYYESIGFSENPNTYIETNLVPTDNTEYRLSFKPKTTTWAIFGASTTTSNGVRLFLTGTALYAGFGANRAQNNANISSGAVHTVVLKKTTLKIDSTTYSVGAGTSYPTTLSIGRDQTWDGGIHGLNGDLYYFQIYESGKLIRDFVPCAYNGTPGLFDKANGVFYPNAGTGTLTLGNKASYSSPIYDCSGYNNNGNVGGTLTSSSGSPRYNKNTVFSNNGYVALGRSLMVKDEITICCWAHMDNWANYNARLISSTEGGGWNFEPSSGKMNFAMGTGVSSNTYKSVQSTTSLSALTSGWHHFVGSYDGFNTKIYIDGTLENTNAAYTTKTPIFYNSTNGVFIGAEATSSETTPGGSYFNGKLSDVRFYATALPADDIKELYNTSALIHNNGTFECYEIDEVNSGLDINSKGVTETATFYEEGILNPSYVTFTGTGATQTPTNNGTNVCSNGYAIVFKDLSVSKKYVIEFDFTWSSTWASGTGGTLNLRFQGANKPTTGTSYVWSGTNYVCSAIMSKQNPLTLVNNSPTGGTYHYKCEFTIPANNAYDGFNLGTRCDYSDGNGTLSYKNLKIYEYEASLDNEKVKFGEGYITSKQFNEI